ncbi:MAG: nucleotidyl transferase AbiEii/AbiGii toxin family protein [Thermoanaerobaculaceae bacterium]
MSTGLVQSVQTRLVQHARTINVDPNLVLVRYASERLLYRLSRSQFADRFVLKGALLLVAWLGETTRPTRDIDLLGFGDQTAGALAGVFAEICALEVAPDGITFDLSSIRVAPIRPEDAYGGNRVVLLARLGNARLRVQVDVGIGDAVTPHPEWLEYPSLLDLPRPRLRAYRRETTIAEKLHAMVVLGSLNSRMRDFFDIQALAARESFDGELLASAIRATFERRATPLPVGEPLALSPHFALIEGKPEQWAGFVRRSRPGTAVDGLGEVVEQIRAFLGPVLAAIATGQAFQASWPPGGPWR